MKAELAREVFEELEIKRGELFSIINRESGYNEIDFAFLWDDLRDYFHKFDIICASIEAAREEINSGGGKAYNKTGIRWLPWGNVLFCPASNAVIPVVPTTLFTLLFCGNTVVFAPSRKTLESTKMIVEILLRRFIQWRDKLVYFEGGGRDAIEQFVKTQKVSLLWFQGDSNHRQSVIKECLDNGVDCYFEGSGNCMTIVNTGSSRDNLATVAKVIYEALNVCGGMLCTTPRVIFINRNILNTFKSYIGDCIGVASLATPKLEMVEYTIENVPKTLLATETFDNCLKLVAFDSLLEVREFLKHYRYGIQLAFFCQEKPESLIRLFGDVHVARFLFNVSPVFQRTSIAWGGYGVSGPNPVATLLEKAQKSVVIHE